MMKFSETNQDKYPATTDCKAVSSQFNQTGTVDYSINGTYYNYAVID